MSDRELPSFRDSAYDLIESVEAVDPSTVLVIAGPSNGTATVAANGVVTYTPRADFNGQAVDMQRKMFRDMGATFALGNGAIPIPIGKTVGGTTTINAGTLQAGAVNAFSSASAFTVASGATLELAGFDQTIGRCQARAT